MIPALQAHTRRKVNPAELTIQTLLDSIHACYLFVDVDLDIFFFNNFYSQWYFKYFCQEVSTGMNLVDTFQPERRQMVKGYANNALRGECIEFEQSFTTPDGKTDWFFIRMNPLNAPTGERMGLCLYFADITKRKQIDMALKASNERYEFVSKITSDAIWDWNLKENKLFWSEGYETSFGYKRASEDENIETWEERIHPDDRNRVVQKLKAVLEDPNACYWEDEYRYVKSDGSYSFIYDRGHVIYENNKATRMVGSMSDITSRKTFEIERDDMTNELIQRNKDLEQFAFIISHNLRSQIANVLGLSDLVRSDLLQHDEKEGIFNQIHSSVLKLDEVVKDINHILHIKRNLSEKKEIVVLQKLFEDVTEAQKLTINQAGVQITADFSEVPAILALKSYIYSIFFNLLGNSIKYRRAGVTPQVHVSAKVDFNKIIIRFEDNGMGIDLKTHGKNIFGLYKRFHQDKDGKGMGLFMVKTQVEAQGGKIEVMSEAGEGTCFIITFSKEILVSLP